jgi:hypothetical protein
VNVTRGQSPTCDPTSRVQRPRTAARGWLLLLGGGLVAALAANSFVEARQGPQPVPQGTGVIRGRVIDGTRGTPIARATVTAMVSVVPAGATGEPGAASHMFGRSRSVRTDADGSFVLTGLPRSRVALSAHREGFHPAAPASRGGGVTVSRQPVLTVEDGATLIAPDLLLVRGAASSMPPASR